MKPNAFLVVSCVLCACSLHAMSAANAQGKNTSGPDQIKAMLLRPAGWKANWSLQADKGVSEIVFETRGDKVVAKIRNLTIPTTCEHDVTITSDTVIFNGCYDWDITLRFDPGDQATPFKGKSGSGYDYSLQPM